MIEDALNRLAAAIEAQNVIQAENQRLFAELVAANRPVTPAAAVVVEPAPKTERKARKAPEQETEGPRGSDAAPIVPAGANGAAGPEPETDTRPVTKKELMDFAMSLSRQDSAFGSKIKAVLAEHGASTIGNLAEDKVGAVFAKLNNAANKHAREG